MLGLEVRLLDGGEMLIVVAVQRHRELSGCRTNPLHHHLSFPLVFLSFSRQHVSFSSSGAPLADLPDVLRHQSA